MLYLRRLVGYNKVKTHFKQQKPDGINVIFLYEVERGKSMIKFIVVDDEPLALENFESLLSWEQYGFRCAGTASNGREALRLLSKRKIDVVFTDIRMPVMDWSCARILKKIILLSRW